MAEPSPSPRPRSSPWRLGIAGGTGLQAREVAELVRASALGWVLLTGEQIRASGCAVGLVTGPQTAAEEAAIDGIVDRVAAGPHHLDDEVVGLDVDRAALAKAEALGIEPRQGRFNAAEIGPMRFSAFLDLREDFSLERIVLDELPSEIRQSQEREAELDRRGVAIADGVSIRAVLLGNAVNTDCAGKVGASAPSIDGQADAVVQALAAAAIDPRTSSYVEAHGTGTALGDPIEVRALAQAFGAGAAGACAIGSVKGNVGHLDAAAGDGGNLPGDALHDVRADTPLAAAEDLAGQLGHHPARSHGGHRGNRRGSL